MMNSKFKKLLIIEGILLLLLGIYLGFLRPRITYQIRGNALSLSESADQLQMGPKGSISVSNAGDPETQETEIASFTFHDLPAGAYTLQVNYDSQKNPEASSYDQRDVTGRISMDAGLNSTGLRFQDLKLRDGKEVQTSTFWVRQGFRMDEIRLHVIYQGEGQLSISAITVSEQLSYRLLIFGGWMLFALFLDGLLYMFMLLRDGKLGRTSGLVMAVGFLTIVLASFPCFLDYLVGGHDLSFHLQRIAALADSLAAGQFPNRIQHATLNGYGYISPLLYGELFLYPFAALYNLGLPLQQCYQIYVILVNAATFATAYVCFRKISENQIYGMVGAAIYLLLPYRLTNLYLRSAVGEFTAMTFLPLILLGMRNVYYADKGELKLKQLIPLIIGATGIIQTHVLTCEMVLIFVIVFMLIQAKRMFRPFRLLRLIEAALITILLNAWFLVPFIQAMQLNLNVTSQAEGARIGGSGVYLGQLFNFFQSYTGGNRWMSMKDEMPLSIGASIIVGIVSFLLFVFLNGGGETKGRTGAPYREACIYMGFLGLALAMSSYYFPWDMLSSWSRGLSKIIGVIQFPWRYLTIASVSGVALCVSMLKYLLENGKKRLAELALASMLVGAIVPGMLFLQQFTNQESGRRVYTCQDVSSMSVGSGEYLLTGTESDLLNVAELESDGAGIVRNFTETNYIYRLDAENPTDKEEMITLPLFNYPNYRAEDETSGESIEIQTAANNRIGVVLPGNYKGTVSIRYMEPALWRVCEIVSILTLLALLCRSASQLLKRRVNVGRKSL